GGARGRAGLSRLPGPSLDQGPRRVLLLRAVQGRGGLRCPPQGAPFGGVPGAPREGRPGRRPARRRDLPLPHRLADWDGAAPPFAAPRPGRAGGASPGRGPEPPGVGVAPRGRGGPGRTGRRAPPPPRRGGGGRGEGPFLSSRYFGTITTRTRASGRS